MLVLTGNKQMNNLHVKGDLAKGDIHSGKTKGCDRQSIGNRRVYSQVSKDGDTLEVSKPVISDSLLKGYSEARLKTMLQNKEISRQQYDKAVKQKDEGEDIHLLS